MATSTRTFPGCIQLAALVVLGLAPAAAAQDHTSVTAARPGGSLHTAAPQLPPTGTTRFVLDGNRVYAELGFVRPDGSVHRALAFVDMGSPAVTLVESLFRELGLDRGRPLRFTVGDLPLEIPGAQVASEAGEPRSMGSDLKVEGVLPAGVLRHYQVVIDYRRRTLTLGRPGTRAPEGVPVPFREDTATGLTAVDAIVDGRAFALTIDNGSAYTWLRRRVVDGWLTAHPDWERGVGAVGASNMMMSGDSTETSGVLLRIPAVRLGPVTLTQVGALGVAGGRSPSPALSLFDWYSTKNAVPVEGWIGGNVLKAFRLTIDYPNRIMYWQRQADPDTSDLSQVGLTLRADRGGYFVAAVARRHGAATVPGVRPGDRLLRVDTLETASATWGQIFNALHGSLGDSRVLVLERGGRRFAVTARVTAF